MKKVSYLEKGKHKDGLHVVILHGMGVQDGKKASIILRVSQFVPGNIFITGLDSDVFHFAQRCQCTSNASKYLKKVFTDESYNYLNSSNRQKPCLKQSRGLVSLSNTY